MLGWSFKERKGISHGSSSGRDPLYFCKNIFSPTGLIIFSVAKMMAVISRGQKESPRDFCTCICLLRLTYQTQKFPGI